MELSKEIHYRLALTLDFLSSNFDEHNRAIYAYADNKKTQDQCNIANHIEVAYLLLGGGTFLSESYLHKAGQKALELADNYSFIDGDHAFIIDNQMSTTNANAWMALACYNSNQPHRATGYINAVLSAIEEKRVNFLYEPACHEDAIKQFKSSPPDEGVVAMALQRSDNHQMAKKVVDILIHRKVALNAYAVWAAAAETVTDEIKRYGVLMVKYINKTRTPAMTSLIAAMAAQVHMAYTKIIDNDPRNQEMEKYTCKLLERVVELQIDDKNTYGYSPKTFKGAFVRNQHNRDIRLDFIVNAANAFLQYLCRNNDWES